jgi:hypothetical protein
MRSEPPAASKSILAPTTTHRNRFRTPTSFNLIGLLASSRSAPRRWRKGLTAWSLLQSRSAEPELGR